MGYVKHDLEKYTKLICTSGNETELICETALFELKTKKANILILGVYRPPSANLDQAINILTEQLDRSLNSHRNIILMGDINVDNLSENNDKLKLDDLLTSYQITRVSLPSTRITRDTAKSIDWICTNINQQIIETSVILSGLSDHTAQIITINTENTTEILKERKRTFSNRAIQLFKARLQLQNWDVLDLKEDINNTYDTFNTIIQNILNETCPLQTYKHKKNNNTKQYWDPECTRLRTEYLKALEKEQCTGSEENKKETARRKKLYDTRLKSLRKKCLTEHISGAENKSRALWQVINKERKVKANNNTELHLRIDNITITKPSEVANCFNSFFSTIAQKTLQDHNNTQNAALDKYQPPPPTEQTFNFKPATPQEILKIIETLKPKSSSGVDNISAKIIKACKNELLNPLTLITNKSLVQGTFPNQLKIAKIYPKYKSGPINETNSYRPISLISTFSKIIEKVVLVRLLNYLELHKLLTNQQHGFLKGRSTATALIQLTEHIIDQLEEGCTATCLFLDFSKAFDCLNHEQLLKKLEHLGIRGTAQNWFRSYLTNRKMVVEISSVQNNIVQRFQSTTAEIHRGVPQGSVLGPVLFLLLTNDMPSWLGDICHTVMYADDTALTIANKSIETLQQNATTYFNKTKQYCASNELVLNDKKTVQMTFSNHHRHNDILLPDLEIKTNTKYLGTIIDNKLTWKPHIDQLCKKLSAGNYVIRRIKQISGLDAAKVAYFALFESHLRYGIATWGGTSKGNLERILINQKRAIRCLADLKYQESCRIHFKNLKILTVVSLYIKEVILHTVKYTTQQRFSDLHQYNTRRGGDYVLPAHHLSMYKKKPSYKGAAFFNHLPEHLKSLPPHRFGKQLTLWLQDKPFYTVEEFTNG